MYGVRLYVVVALWGSSLLLERVIPLVLIAKVAVAVCIAALLHALAIALTIWLYRKGAILHTIQRLGLTTERQQFTLLVAAMSSWYFATAIHNHSSLLRAAAIEAAYCLGVWLYLQRATVRRELARQLVERLRWSRQT